MKGRRKGKRTIETRVDEGFEARESNGAIEGRGEWMEMRKEGSGRVGR